MRLSTKEGSKLLTEFASIFYQLRSFLCSGRLIIFCHWRRQFFHASFDLMLLRVISASMRSLVLDWMSLRIYLL
jgi:hypothetical protein